MARAAHPAPVFKPSLPEPLPDSPLALFEAWLAEASAVIRNAGAMTLATVTPDGRPSARMVICRGFDARAGWFVFYTDRESAKGAALSAHPRAALVFHWDAFERQVRIEGPVTHSPDSESDAYWATRVPEARVAAAASAQSQPIASRAELLARVEAVTRHRDGDVPRPSRWGGYRVWAERIELWVGQPARVHDRAAWTRSLTRVGSEFVGGAWSATRLQP
jgi:pyridoxamine 5'-phosphate oxidase